MKKTGIVAENPFMQAAIEEALQGIRNLHGGPFGAVVVKNGEIVGRGHNRVIADHDPTCHGEVAAIRNACANLETWDLTGCEIYTTGEPCPMCLYACLWANIEKIYYGCTLADNSLIGFRDQLFEDLTGGRKRLENYLVCIDREACLELFREYMENKHTVY